MTEEVGFLNEVTWIKNRILELFLGDDYLMRLVSDRADITWPALVLRFKQVYPYEYTMGTTTESKAFITFEMTASARTDINDRQHPAIVNLNLYVYAFCHEDVMMVDDTVAHRLGITDKNKRGSRIDLMCARIDELLNGSELSSFGRFVFQSQEILNPVALNYHGKCNVYFSLNANRYGGAL